MNMYIYMLIYIYIQEKLKIIFSFEIDNKINNKETRNKKQERFFNKR